MPYLLRASDAMPGADGAYATTRRTLPWSATSYCRCFPSHSPVLTYAMALRRTDSCYGAALCA
eukprot:2191609-Rhodomonas_salina.3